MSDKKLEQIVLGGGCFWCIEAPFQQLEGVVDVISGYMGGKVKNPTYREICSGLTGHAEVVKVTFDPEIISFEKILEVFWTVHDPTTLNRQGNDIGSQYRSVIFYSDNEQKTIALEHIARLNNSGVLDNKVVTEVKEEEVFYPAEENHQDYYINNPDQPYCAFIVKPKIEKVRKLFTEHLKK